MILVFFALTGCARYAPVSLHQPVRIAPDPSTPAVCLSMLPDGPRFPKGEAEAWMQVREALAAAEPKRALEIAEPLADHPVKRILRGFPGSPYDEDLSDLLAAHPDDPCLHMTAGLALLQREDSRGVELLQRARELKPDDPDFLVTALIVMPPEQAVPAALEGVEKHRDHAPLHVMAARILIDAGQEAEGFAMLERAVELGAAQFESELLHGRRVFGRLDAYLAQVAELFPEPLAGVPLGDTPFANLETWLGVGEDQVLQATFETSAGDIPCRLFHREAPVTVASFVGLARGGREWTDPSDGQTTARPLYDGTIFHRVIPGFMIQGGDPLGEGTGNAGYRFLDEIHPDFAFDHAGVLAMANSGPQTNGSQFFITDAPTPHLDGRHTIFGDCDAPDIVSAIATAQTGPRDKPVEDVVIRSIALTAIPE